MSENYDIEKERKRIKKLIKMVLKENEEKMSIKNIKIVNLKVNKEIISDNKNNN